MIIIPMIRLYLQDSRFNKEVDKQTGYHTCSILCMPILNYEDVVIGVAQIMNKNGGEVFTEEDEMVRAPSCYIPQ